MHYLAIYLHFVLFAKHHAFHFFCVWLLCEISTNFYRERTVNLHSTYYAPLLIFNSVIICALTFARIYI